MFAYVDLMAQVGLEKMSTCLYVLNVEEEKASEKVFSVSIIPHYQNLSILVNHFLLILIIFINVD